MDPQDTQIPGWDALDEPTQASLMREGIQRPGWERARDVDRPYSDEEVSPIDRGVTAMRAAIEAGHDDDTAFRLGLIEADFLPNVPPPAPAAKTLQPGENK